MQAKCPTHGLEDIVSRRKGKYHLECGDWVPESALANVSDYPQTLEDAIRAAFTEPESFDAAKRELDEGAAGVRLAFLKGYVTGGQTAVMRMQTTGTWEPVTCLCDAILPCPIHDEVPVDYDPTDAEQGPLEQGWAKSRQYDLEHRKENPDE